MSSFVPAICTLLCYKQNRYPVLFLSDAVVDRIKYDDRLNSIEQAISFSKMAGCVGIVLKVQALLQTPGLISFIQNQGMLVYTYGAPNNELSSYLKQRKHGVNGIIVDNVASFR
jgi:glycerophosphoryl diester phosphodiesterase